MSLLLEGGPALQLAAWRERLIDQVQLYIAPCALRPGGVPWLDARVLSMATLPDLRVVPLGPDVLIEGHVHRVD
jgi:riboflavin biosynthesis pyrimidine reductase